jgi:TPR repeat protein
MVSAKQYADAVKVYSMMLEATPTDSYALSWRGYAYASLQDPRAIADFTAAANLGNTYSQNRLGQYSLDGIPGILPKDRAAAIEWFRKAAAAGDPEGVRNLKAALSGAPLDTHGRPSAHDLSTFKQ